MCANVKILADIDNIKIELYINSIVIQPILGA